MGRSRVPLGDLSEYCCGGVLIRERVEAFLLSKSMAFCCFPAGVYVWVLLEKPFGYRFNGFELATSRMM